MASMHVLHAISHGLTTQKFIPMALYILFINAAITNLVT